MFRVYDNVIEHTGTGGVYGQDYGITINPGSLGFYFDNEISATAKSMQILDSRVFFHAPE